MTSQDAHYTELSKQAAAREKRANLFNLAADEWSSARQSAKEAFRTVVVRGIDGKTFTQTFGEKPTNPKDAIATDKLPLHLVSPIVKAYQAIAHYLGNVKYGAWNWRAAGIRASVYKSAAERHLDAWWEGEDTDPADGTPHLANALCCLNIIIEATHCGNMTDDRPPSRDAELAKVRAQFEALMPKIRAKYADKTPHHYTIGDAV